MGDRLSSNCGAATAEHGGVLPHLIVSILIAAIHFASVLPVRCPVIFYDELVYLGFARYFAHAASMPNLYAGVLGHFGYSFFLAPAFFLPGFTIEYKLVLVINSLLFTTLYASIYYILCATAPEIPRRIRMSISILCCLYPSYLLYPTFAGSENAFVPMFAAVIAMALRYFDRPSIPAGLVLGLLATLTFAIHNRGLSTLIVLVVIVSIRAVRRQLPALSSAMLILAGAVGYVSIITAKHYIERETGALFPAPGVQVYHLSRVAMCLGGQLFALCVGTAGLYIFGVSSLTAMIIRKASKPALRDSAALALLSHAVVLVGSAMFISNQDLRRLDHILIERYNEGTLAPILALGMSSLYLMSRKAQVRRIWITAAASLAFMDSFALLNAPRIPRLESLPQALLINMMSIEPVAGMLRPGDVETLALYGMLISALVAYAAVKQVRISAAVVAALFIASAGVTYRSDVVEIQQVYPPRSSSGSPAALSSQLERLSARGVREVAFDERAWTPFFFSIYQLFDPQLHFQMFDSRLQAAPRAAAIIASPSWSAYKSYRNVGAESGGGSLLWVRDDLSDSIEKYSTRQR